MRENKLKRLEDILTDPNSSPHERSLAVCLLEIKSKLDYLERVANIQVALMSSVILGLITLALAVKGVI